MFNICYDIIWNFVLAYTLNTNEYDNETANDDGFEQISPTRYMLCIQCIFAKSLIV